jgi:hypothetical protein
MRLWIYDSLPSQKASFVRDYWRFFEEFRSDVY